ncbi:hypothetical protein SacN8_08245 [Sulfolobus acidocaldarius N8]|nr:hypothetical protein SacN8_08245 [Sulfolobus acidocaldarius N8]AGE73882.1 hypothetical protein SacRon12I_08255 [Sulfolobus acidocaldarius Ron12/I]
MDMKNVIDPDIKYVDKVLCIIVPKENMNPNGNRMEKKINTGK